MNLKSVTSNRIKLRLSLRQLIISLRLMIGAIPCVCGIAIIGGITDLGFHKGGQIYEGRYFTANWVLRPHSMSDCIASSKGHNATCVSGNDYCSFYAVEDCDPYFSYLDCVISNLIKLRIEF